MTTKLFDSAVIHEAQEAVYFIANVLEASTQYSIIGKAIEQFSARWRMGSLQTTSADIPI